MQATRTEEWMKFVCGGVSEGVNVDSRFRTVEGHTALCAVQIYAHLLRLLFEGHQSDR